MRDPRKEIEVYNEVLGLLDAACAKLQPIIAEETEHNARLLMGLWRGITRERAYMAEILRATHELVNCQCVGLEHNMTCPARPG